MDYTLPQYSKTRIDKAGGLLLAPKPWTEGADVEDALEIINNHRASHNYPLLVFRIDLARKAHRVDAAATIAQRIKRLRSIEAKLRRFPQMRLSHMQDIGGCRAVVRNVRAVKGLASLYRKSKARHERLRIKNYLDEPPESGYRGIHLVYRFQSPKHAAFNGLKIEIQLRSRQQHAWATAVETVDTFTGQALKGGKGTKEWERFFALMSAYIAGKELCNAVPNTPLDPDELRGEIVHYVNELEVLTHLQSYRGTLQQYHVPNADYYLVELNASKWETYVQGYTKEKLGQAQNAYLQLEREIAGERGRDAVLVSASSLASLKRAYPNYFADTHVFIQTLQEATGNAPIQ